MYLATSTAEFWENDSLFRYDIEALASMPGTMLYFPEREASISCLSFSSLAMKFIDSLDVLTLGALGLNGLTAVPATHPVTASTPAPSWKVSSQGTGATTCSKLVVRWFASWALSGLATPASK